MILHPMHPMQSGGGLGLLVLFLVYSFYLVVGNVRLFVAEKPITQGLEGTQKAQLV